MTYQQLTIVGNVGRDPELRYTPAGVAVTDFSLAVSESWNDAQGQRQERTTWYRVTCWRQLAETVARYVKKGRQVLVISNRIEARSYTGNDGQPRASLDVTADTVRFLGNRNDNANPQDVAAGGYDEDFAPPADDVDDIPF